jgi:hypothetical protein
VRGDIAHSGNLVELALIPAREDAADVLDTQAQTGDLQMVIVAAMLWHIQRAFDDPTYRSPCILSKQRLGVERVVWFALLPLAFTPHAVQPRFPFAEAE